MNRFLIDECLSPALADAARARGFDAVHIVWLGRSSADDREVARIALERDYVVVTNNARDFLKIYKTLGIHPGLMLILPAVAGPRQKELFLLLLEAVEAVEAIVNQVVAINEKGAVTMQDWSAAEL